MANILHVSVFQRHLSTLKDTSYDSAHNHYMSQSTYPAVNFDDVKDDLFIGFNDYKSNDALLIPQNNGEKYVFIEFKNGDVTSSLKREKIRTKIAESLVIFNDILNVTISFDKFDLIYMLVYNKAQNTAFENQRSSPIAGIANHLAGLAGTSYLINGFDRYKKIFKDVYTINEIEFKNSFSDKLDSGTYPF